MNQATAILISRALSGLISLTTAYIGAQQAADVIDRIRRKMVEQGRAPTEGEIADLFTGLEDRSDQIQSNGE